MVRRVTRWFPLPPDVVLLLILRPPTRFYTGWTGNQTGQILQRYIEHIDPFETI
jgi:hypothetical protein